MLATRDLAVAPRRMCRTVREGRGRAEQYTSAPSLVYSAAHLHSRKSAARGYESSTAAAAGGQRWEGALGVRGRAGEGAGYVNAPRCRIACAASTRRDVRSAAVLLSVIYRCPLGTRSSPALVLGPVKFAGAGAGLVLVLALSAAGWVGLYRWYRGLHSR